MAFIAVDTDYIDLDRLQALDSSERFCLPDGGNLNLRYNIPNNRTAFDKDWIHPAFCADLTHPGTCQIRQVALAKLYAQTECSGTADIVLREKIKMTANGIAKNTNPSVRLRVHVLVSIGGGTGSGLINEIARIVHEALRPQYGVNFDVCAYVLLPDTTEQFLDLPGRDHSYANGYTALKELDYYYSAFQRISSYTMKNMYDKDLYKHVFLFSGNSRGNKGLGGKINTARDTVSHAIIQQMTVFQDMGIAPGLTTRLHNYIYSSRQSLFQKLSPGGADDANHHYSAIGVATADLPWKTIYGYACSRVLHTVFGKEHNLTPGAPINSFMSYSATQQEAASPIKTFEGTVKRLKEMIRQEVDRSLCIPEELVVCRQEILAGIAESRIVAALDTRENIKSIMDRLTLYLHDAYVHFLSHLTQFLNDYGPKAYADLWKDFKYSMDLRSLQNQMGVFDRNIDIERQLDRAFYKVSSPLLAY